MRFQADDYLISSQNKKQKHWWCLTTCIHRDGHGFVLLWEVWSQKLIDANIDKSWGSVLQLNVWNIGTQ